MQGASVILYRSADIRKYQIFVYADWPGGLFGSPGMAGSRPGSNLASSWATLMLMGQDGYMEVAKRLMDVTRSMTAQINEIDVSVYYNSNVAAISVIKHSSHDHSFSLFDCQYTIIISYINCLQN